MPTNLVNNMLPNIFELVLRERFAEELNRTKLKKNGLQIKDACINNHTLTRILG